jgi:quercetin dioxygenase-like cupin family protein
MKTVTVHQWDGMRADVWRLDTGDKIERHSHPFVHATSVALGSTRVTQYGDHGFMSVEAIMRPGEPDFAFPANVGHKIEALEDGTIVVNLSHGSTPPGEPGKDGGITFDS